MQLPCVRRLPDAADPADQAGAIKRRDRQPFSVADEGRNLLTCVIHRLPRRRYMRQRSHQDAGGLLALSRTDGVERNGFHGVFQARLAARPKAPRDQSRWNFSSCRCWAVIRRTVPVTERMTTVSVSMISLPNLTPRSMAPSVTPVAANRQS